MKRSRVHHQSWTGPFDDRNGTIYVQNQRVKGVEVRLDRHREDIRVVDHFELAFELESRNHHYPTDEDPLRFGRQDDGDLPVTDGASIKVVLHALDGHGSAVGVDLQLHGTEQFQRSQFELSTQLQGTVNTVL
ncbi:MAG UNVERIFIED_CONTAM: hypothetical protein LVR18_51635 [Planctomycetaceae bacterium]